MKKGDHIQIRKLSPIPDAKVSSGDPKFYQYGSFNPDVSLPDDYVVKGYFATDVEVGEPVRINRYERNGEKVTGIMVTSPVTGLLANRIYTENSVYDVIAI